MPIVIVYVLLDFWYTNIVMIKSSDYAPDQKLPSDYRRAAEGYRQTEYRGVNPDGKPVGGRIEDTRLKLAEKQSNASGNNERRS